MSRVHLYKTLWGVPEIDNPLLWPSLFRRIKADGFEGIEHVGPGSPFFAFGSDQQGFKALLEENGLVFILQVHTCGYPTPAASAEDHLASLRMQIGLALPLNPILVNSHSGKDSFTIEESLQFFVGAVAVEKDLGVQISQVFFLSSLRWPRTGDSR